jgi:hypothetical protein
MHFLPDRSFLAVIDAQDAVDYIVAILCDHLEDEMADPRRVLAIGQATKGVAMDVDERDAMGRGLLSFSEVSCRQSWEAAARTLRTGSCGVASAGIEAASASPMAKCSLMIVPPARGLLRYDFDVDHGMIIRSNPWRQAISRLRLDWPML